VQVDAVIAAGLDIERFLAGGYDPRTIETVIAWKKTRALIDVHTQDAVSIASEKKSKTKGRR